MEHREDWLVDADELEPEERSLADELLDEVLPPELDWRGSCGAIRSRRCGRAAPAATSLGPQPRAGRSLGALSAR